MAEKIIKKIKVGDDTYQIKDVEAITHINGYSNTQLIEANITFAEKPISDVELDGILNGTITSSTSLD